jgi:hypothetical protein
VRVIRHLLPRLADDIEPLVLAVIRLLAREVEHVVLDEDERGDVLEQLRLRVDLAPFLADRLLHALDRRVVVAGLPQQRARRLGVERVQARSPLQVAVAVHREAIARNRPALDVLRTHRKPDRLGRGRREPFEHLAHALGIQQLARNGLAVRAGVATRVLAVGRIEKFDRPLETRIPAHHRLSRVLANLVRNRSGRRIVSPARRHFPRAAQCRPCPRPPDPAS